MNDLLTIRLATIDDTPLILYFIKSLAAYEKMEHRLKVTEERLKDSLFNKKHAEVLLAFEHEKPVGFAVFFHTFSTFYGDANLYLEDLFIEESFRGKGYGKSLLKALSKIALQRQCEYLKWSCLDWNTPSIDFYKSLGAKQVNEWLYFSLDHDGLISLINKK